MNFYDKLSNPRSPAQLAMFGEMIQWSIDRFDEIGAVEEARVSADGHVNVSIDRWSSNGCHDRFFYSIPLEVFFSKLDLSAWTDEQDRLEVEAKKARLEAEKIKEMKRIRKAKTTREANKAVKERAEYERLRAKFETQVKE